MGANKGSNWLIEWLKTDVANLVGEREGVRKGILGEEFMAALFPRRSCF